MLQRLAAPDAVCAIDVYLEREAEYKNARRQALATCGRLRGDTDSDARRSLRRTVRQVAGGGVPAPLPDNPEMTPFLDVLAQAQKD